MKVVVCGLGVSAVYCALQVCARVVLSGWCRNRHGVDAQLGTGHVSGADMVFHLVSAPMRVVTWRVCVLRECVLLLMCVFA